MTPPPESRKYLWDALRSADRVLRLTASRTFEEYLGDDFRNILAHGYEVVDDRMVWGVVENHLPPLRSTLARLLGEDEGG